MTYASGTTVQIERSQRDIEELVSRSGASKFMRGHDQRVATVLFEIAERRIMFELQLPKLEDFAVVKVGAKRPKTKRLSPDQQEWAHHQACKARWRALYLTIKAKLVSVEAGIETFEEAFLAQVVVPHNGRAERFGKVATEAILAAYGGGKLPPLLSSGEP